MEEKKNPQNKNHKFSYSERLHLQKDFDKTLKLGRKMVHPAIFIYVNKRNDGTVLRRLGLITSGKIGNAVQRNRVKRRLREIFRLHKNDILPGTDLIFISRKPAVSMKYKPLEDTVLSLIGRAGAII